MPELPEVEVVRRGLEENLINSTISFVAVFEKKLRWPVPANLSRKITGRRLVKVERKSKWLLLHFDPYWLIIHLGMSGSLFIKSNDAKIQIHDRIIFCFKQGIQLIFNDPRKFGSVHLVKDPENFKFFKKLSPEPWDELVTCLYCYNMAIGKSVNLKSFVLSGRPITGVGNIYACEILFLAKLNPFKPVHEVSEKEWERFIFESRAILHKAIESGGTTLRDFSGVDGKPGYFFRELYVYGQEGESCPTCGLRIEKIKQQGRSTYYCPYCQGVKR